MKTLFLNGVAVGEYLGSDDLEEDLQAARQALRNKGLYNPPSVAQGMLNQAVAFASASRLAYDEMQKRGPRKPPLTAVPFVVNAAFAVELYFKTILFARDLVAPKRLHELVKLHALLPADERAALQESCTKHLPGYDPRSIESFAERLVPLNDAFIRWRYAYEHERVGTLRPSSLILVLMACHDRCVKIVRR